MIPKDVLYDDDYLRSDEASEDDLFRHFGAFATDAVNRGPTDEDPDPASFVCIADEGLRVLEVATGIDETDTWVDAVISAVAAGGVHLAYSKVAKVLGVDPELFERMIETRFEQGASVLATDVMAAIEDPTAWWNRRDYRDAESSPEVP